MSEEALSNFIAITDCDDPQLATSFIEMAGGDLNTAIALYFEHHSSASAPQPTSNTTNTNTDNNVDDLDEQLAQRLQNEENQAMPPQQNDEVRAPMEFRREVLTETSPSQQHGFVYGGIGGPFQHLSNVNDMFDNSRPMGIFNQRLTNDEEEGVEENVQDSDDSDVSMSMEDSDEDSDEYEYVEEPVVEIDDDGNIQEHTRLVKKLKTFSKEERLARLFRPPFEIMSKLTLDGAKAKGARKGKMKWIMINIQDNGIFQCQALNRDVWSSRRVRRLVKKNFIFLQYQYESRLAEQYLNFYNLHDKDDLPHIAILDPMTGERVKQWNTYLPTEEEFLQEINNFLDEFSLDPSASNPIVKEPTPELDPTTMTEEQQMDMAIRESLSEKSTEPTGTAPSTATTEEQEEEKKNSKATTEDPFDAIEAIEHTEPENKPGVTTRIQIRTGDGTRFVRRFNCHEDTVQTIYEVVKTELAGYESCHFILSDHQRHNLIDKLKLSIKDAGLKNSSLLLESSSDDGDEEE